MQARPAIYAYGVISFVNSTQQKTRTVGLRGPTHTADIWSR